MSTSAPHMAQGPTVTTIANIASVIFTVIILIYAGSGPISEFVRWFIEATTAGFDEMSRRDQRALLREHWLGSAYRGFERNFILPTGLILGLPIAFSFTISFLGLNQGGIWPRVHQAMAALSLLAILAWIAKIFGTDVGLLPSAEPIDFIALPVATALTLYLTWRMFGGFIVAFCLFWVVYFFVRGALPEWTGRRPRPKTSMRWCKISGRKPAACSASHCRLSQATCLSLSSSGRL